MKVMIVGGNGFIGGNLSRYLQKAGYEVIVFDTSRPAVDIPGIRYVTGNFFKENDLIPYLPEMDVVIHAVSSINPGNSNELYMQGYDNDFVYSVRLADYSIKYKFQLIFLSSGGTVYGVQKNMPITEEAICVPVNHYGNLKLCVENTYRTFITQSKADIKIARIANPYGAGQDYRRGVGLIDAVIKCALQKKPVNIMGGGIVRDYIHIDDVCAMLERLMHYTGPESVFNIGSGVGTSQTQIIDYVTELEPDLEVMYISTRSVDVPCIILDNTRIMQIYGRGCIDIKSGIKEHYDYVKGKEDK